MVLDLSISILTLGSKFVAVTKIGGFTIRGKAANDTSMAIRNLFFVLQEDEDASLGIELALENKTIETALLDAGKTS